MFYRTLVLAVWLGGIHSLPEISFASDSTRVKPKLCAYAAVWGIGGDAGTSSKVSHVILSYGTKGHWLSLAGSWVRGSYDVTSFLSGKASGHRHEDFLDIGLLYGRRLVSGKVGYIYLGTGVSYAQSKETGEDLRVVGSDPYEYVWQPIPTECSSFWGIPAVLQFALRAGSFGFVAEYFANINDDEEIGCIAFGIHVGS